MTGHCWHCHRETFVARYRVADIGLRWACPDCIERLSAVGMAAYLVPDEGERVENCGIENRRNWKGSGIRQRASDLVRRVA